MPAIMQSNMKDDNRMEHKKEEQKWPSGGIPQNLKTQAKSLRPVPSGAEGTKNAKQTHFQNP